MIDHRSSIIDHRSPIIDDRSPIIDGYQGSHGGYHGALGGYQGTLGGPHGPQSASGIPIGLGDPNWPRGPQFFVASCLVIFLNILKIFRTCYYNSTIYYLYFSFFFVCSVWLLVMESLLETTKKKPPVQFSPLVSGTSASFFSSGTIFSFPV